MRSLGYYNSSVNIFVNNKIDNLVDVEINLDIGNKSKITKITFIVNKIFKDSKLKWIIASSEYKYWKFLTGRNF